MAVSSLIRQLARRYGQQRSSLSRRELLKRSLAAGGALLLTDSSAAATMLKSKVVVVGAGFAGLVAAYELQQRGFDVTVVEARKRVGGRVLSFHDFVPNRNVEGGGELIGSNHIAWLALANKFNLELVEMGDDDADTPIVLDGVRLSSEAGAALWEQLDNVLSRLNEAARHVDTTRPWLSPNAVTWDAMSLANWIDQQRDAEPVVLRALDAQLAADNGVAPSWQSYLANLTMIAGGGVEAFWTESETHRCRGGNQQLALKLLDVLAADSVRLETAVTAIDYSKPNISVRLSNGQLLECDQIVLAVPPSVWRKISFSPSLPAVLRPQMGSNVKFLSHVRSRFWQPLGLSQYSLSNGAISMTWDATDGQSGDGSACMVAFSGGEASERCRSWSDLEREDNYVTELERYYGGTRSSFVASRFMDWPSDPWAGASYSFPAPGQITSLGPILERGLEGRLHFAGEHTCWAFVGYMEGALQSGLAVARRISEG